jgi:hypothetical protein
VRLYAQVLSFDEENNGGGFNKRTQSQSDLNLFACGRCGGTGELICCDTCVRARVLSSSFVRSFVLRQYLL